jgi:hypothetical protein
MIKPFHILGHATRLLWREWIGLMFLNILWVIFQIPIITGPPATAVLYAMAERVYDDELWDIRETWQLLRDLFWPAWRWALPNMIIALVLLFNITTYWSSTGLGWIILRLLWVILLSFWIMLNLFYWPFWLAQEDKSLRTTYGNCARFLILNLWPALIITIVCVVIVIGSILTTLPMLVLTGAWLALVGVTTVQRALALQKLKE